MGNKMTWSISIRFTDNIQAYALTTPFKETQYSKSQLEKITGECQEAKLNLIQLRTERDRLLELVADADEQHVTTKEEFNKLDELLQRPMGPSCEGIHCCDDLETEKYCPLTSDTKIKYSK